MQSVNMQSDEIFKRFSNYVNNRLQLYFASNGDQFPTEELPEIDNTAFKGKKLNL